ncbi:MAG: hypothetical protein QG578_1883 [Thermodesulfobacteriota bacterium]|nr:hypothetical protein [Thermodesulfobacteriota bacterium]
MKKRYLYALLFGIPGFFVSVIISFIVFGAAAGISWIYLFGDDPWPAAIEKVLPILFVITFLIAWITSVIFGFAAGKKLEKNPDLNKKHILVSIGVTIAPILLMILHQFSVGNIGPKPDSILCSDYCAQKGYAGSGMPPRDSGDRSCSCFDNSGREVLKVPIDSIDTGKQ